MAYVSVPNDLSRIKTKLAFNLTKRQLICFSIAGGIGIPFYLFTRSHIGNSTALFLMIGLMIGQLMKAATQGTIIGAGVGLVLGVVLFLRDAKLRRGVRERLLAENRE